MRGFGISQKRNVQLGYYLLTYVRRILWQNSRTGVGQRDVQTETIRSKVAVRVDGRRETVLRSSVARRSALLSVLRSPVRNDQRLPMRHMHVLQNHVVSP